MFTEIENAVLTTRIFRMPQKQALEWIKTHHKEISRQSYYRIISKIESNIDKRKRKFMLEGVFTKQIDAIDRIELLLTLSFENAEKAMNDKQYRTAQFINNSIAKLQEILTSYYDEIQSIIEYDADKEREIAHSIEIQREKNLIAFFTTNVRQQDSEFAF